MSMWSSIFVWHRNYCCTPNICSKEGMQYPNIEFFFVGGMGWEWGRGGRVGMFKFQIHRLVSSWKCASKVNAYEGVTPQIVSKIFFLWNGAKDLPISLIKKKRIAS
jgi:hypothetical protein